MNLSQQSSHIVLGPSATMPTPAVPASAVATAMVAAGNDIGGGGGNGDDSIKTPLLTEKEVQVGSSRNSWVFFVVKSSKARQGMTSFHDTFSGARGKYAESRSGSESVMYLHILRDE